MTTAHRLVFYAALAVMATVIALIVWAPVPHVEPLPVTVATCPNCEPVPYQEEP